MYEINNNKNKKLQLGCTDWECSMGCFVLNDTLHIPKCLSVISMWVLFYLIYSVCIIQRALVYKGTKGVHFIKNELLLTWVDVLSSNFTQT